MADDVDAIRRVLAGDTGAFRFLVERYEGPLFRFVANLVPDAHAREDLAQEAFLSAFRNLATFDPEKGRFSTWLFTLARNRCLTALRKKAPRPAAFLPPRAVDRTPHDRLEEKDFMESLDRALADLPVEQRSAFVLREFVELPYEEIARVEGVDAGTARSRVSRAKARLRSALALHAGGDA